MTAFSSGFRSATLWVALAVAGLVCLSGCSTHQVPEPSSPGLACRLDGVDMQVLSVVLEEIVLGSGVCTGPGELLLYAATVRPDFPETVEQARRRREAEQQIAAGQAIDADDLGFEFETPRGSGLMLDTGLEVTKEVVDAAFAREGCALGDIEVPPDWHAVRLEPQERAELFAAGIQQGWKRLHRRYPHMECLVRFSAPAFSESLDRTFVSYTRMSGSLGGMGGFVVLEFLDGGWQVEWHESLWVS